jgi:hypothetical protein
MITTQQYNSLNSSGIKSAVAFGIKDSGLAHIFNVLRNQLYTDKIGAVVREYSANAYDANVEAGNGDKSIRITLPSPLEKTFKVRDFGRGLTQEDIQEIYCFYGESTKRQSNAYIGQLGLGSKSAFAYGDNFLINSFVDGKVSSYNAFIDPSGIGQIALLSTQDTSEPNGVEICIAVKGEDCREFNKSVNRYLRYFKVKPEIIGMNEQELSDMFLPPVSSGDRWSFYKNVNSPTAIMGNIGYPLSLSSMKLDMSRDDDKKIYNLLSSSIVLNFEIGDLDVAASREGLQYTDRTLSSVRTLALQVVNKIVAEIEQNIGSTAKSVFGAKKLLYSMDNFVDGFYHLRKIMDKITFKGIPITNANAETTKRSKDGLIGFYVMRYEQNWNSNVRATNVDSFEANGRSVIVFNDMGNYNSGARNARYLASTDKQNRVFLFTPQVRKITNGVVQDTKAVKADELATYAIQIAEAKRLNGYCDEDFILASSIVVPSNVVGTNTKTARTGVLTFDLGKASHYRNREGWTEAKADIKNGTGIYVQVNNYQAVLNDNKFGNSTLGSLLNIFPKVKSHTIVGVTGTQMKNLGKGWVHIFDAMKEEFESFVKSNAINLDMAIANRLAGILCRDLAFRNITDRKVQAKLLQGLKSPDMARTMSAVFDAINGKAGSVESEKAIAMYDALVVRNTSNKTLVEANSNSKKIADAIHANGKTLCKRFPLLENLEYSSFRWDNWEKATENLLDYLNR